MSFDLHLFDMDVPDDPETISDLLEDDSTWNDPLTQRLTPYDPQNDVVTRPTRGAAPSNRWCKRS